VTEIALRVLRAGVLDEHPGRNILVLTEIALRFCSFHLRFSSRDSITVPLSQGGGIGRGTDYDALMMRCARH
jgi:hypothetical protein